MLNLLNAFKRCFDRPSEPMHIIDHGDPVHFGPWKYMAPNGEGQIDVHANNRTLTAIASHEFWHGIEREVREGL